MFTYTVVLKVYFGDNSFGSSNDSDFVKLPSIVAINVRSVPLPNSYSVEGSSVGIAGIVVT